MTTDTTALDQFRNALKRDTANGLVSEWMTAWYWKEIDRRFGDSQSYNGPKDVARWIHSQSTCRRYPTPKNLPDISDRIAIQIRAEQRVLSHAIFEQFRNLTDTVDYKNHAAYSAQDYYFQTLEMSDNQIENATVVDFGPGAGRLSAQWTVQGATYIGVEGIPETYCIQKQFYSLVYDKFVDYLDKPDLKIKPDSKILYHIPSWRQELIPDKSVDLVSTVQVLGELRPEMLNFTVDQFARIIKPGGFLYIRDHGKRHNPNKMNIPETVAARGFELLFEPDYTDLEDVHGIPKLWKRIMC